MQVILILAVVVVASGVGVYWYVFMRGPAGEPVKIGFIGALTSAPTGLWTTRASTLAAIWVNDHGGVLGRPMEVVYGDSEGSPEKAVAAAENLILVHEVVGLGGLSSSSQTLAVIDTVLPKNPLPIISTGYWDEITNRTEAQVPNRRFIFRTLYTSSYIVDGMADFIKEALKVSGVNKAVIFGAKGGWMETGLKRTMAYLRDQGYGDDVLRAYWYPALASGEVADFTVELYKIKDEYAPQVFMTDVLGTNRGILNNQLKTIIGADCICNTLGDLLFFMWDEYEESCGGPYYADYTLNMIPWYPGLNVTEVGAWAHQEYYDTHGEQPTDWTWYYFDPVLIYADSINRAGTTEPETLWQYIETCEVPTIYLEKTHFYTQASEVPEGPFKESGAWYHASVPLMLHVQWQYETEGKTICVYPPEYATGTLKWPSG
jgi:branched-chain amino acid transport system substrate-binding protein